MLLPVALAIAPGLAICLYFFYRDVHDREPALNLVMSFFWGMLTIIPAAIIEEWTTNSEDTSIVGILLKAFVMVAFVEEGGKYLALRGYAYRRREFDEPLDGIVYSVMVSMGFATLENVFYAIQFGYETAILRIFTAVPAHATFGVLMGHYVGKAKFDPSRKKRPLLQGILAATFAHGCYDAFLFMNENQDLRDYVSQELAALLFFAGALVSLIVAVVLSRRLLMLHHAASKQLFSGPTPFTIQLAGPKSAAAIRNLAYRIWPHAYRGILSRGQIGYMLRLMYSEAALKKNMAEGHHFLIACHGNIPAGFAAFSEVEPGLVKLHKIYVLPRQQGRGLGRFLINAVLQSARNSGATAIQLNINRNNTARQFYEKLGFEVIRTEDIAIGKGFEMNDYVMQLRLREEDANTSTIATGELQS